jgi:hypothetical protein
LSCRQFVHDLRLSIYTVAGIIYSNAGLAMFFSRPDTKSLLMITLVRVWVISPHGCRAVPVLINSGLS